MDIVKKMQVPVPFLFDQITNSVLYDIQQATGKKLTEKQLDGFEYVKEFSKNQRANIKIEKYHKDQAYHYSTATNRNQFFVQYDIVPISDTVCELHYIEKMESTGSIQKMNDMIVGMLLSHFKKKRFKEMLKQMEQSYQTAAYE